MSIKNLRNVVPVNYYVPDELPSDEYIYCDECSDYVFEYCSLHGSLLVIPDDKVTNRSKYPSYVPRAALTIPRVFLHIAPSVIPGAGLGVFSTRTLPRGVRFGPYHGQRRDRVESMYCWQIYDKNNKPSHVIDAADGDKSNWMRYVNCARHWCEQNLVAYQYQGQLYYRTIKTVPRFTELLIFYGTEFAEALNIDVKIYNSDNYYFEALRASLETPTVIEETEETPKISHKNLSKTIENFAFIDQLVIEENSSKFDYVLNFDDKINNKINEFTKNDIKNICEICDKTFATKKNLNRHKLIHGDNKKFKCQLCSYQTNFKNRIDTHKGRHTLKCNYNCNICAYATNSKRNLSKHLKCHLSSNILKCQYCDYKTFQKLILEFHLKMHESENVVKCHKCDYLTDKNKYMNRHVRNVHNKIVKELYFCDYCGYSCYDKNLLVNHIQTHIY